jgi:hypothetical protein
MNEALTVSATLEKAMELERPEVADREHVLAAIELRLSQLVVFGPEPMWQLLYRLDVAEKPVIAALEHNENALGTIAQLIYDRQLEKARSRAAFRSGGNPLDDDELRW